MRSDPVYCMSSYHGTDPSMSHIYLPWPTRRSRVMALSSHITLYILCIFILSPLHMALPGLAYSQILVS